MKHNVEITKEMLEKFISDSCMEFTLEELEALMDSEAEKPEEEMDTELIDMCAAALAKAHNPDFKEGKPSEMYRPWESENAQPAKPKKKVIPLRRILLVAAVLALVLAVALPAGAKLFDNKASDGIIEFYSDFFKINLNKDEPTVASENDMVNQMILDSLNTLMLPQVLLSDEYERTISSVKQDEDKTIIFVTLNCTKNDIKGNICITQYKDADHNMTNGQVNIPDTHREFKQILIKDKEIIVFTMGEESYINYSDRTTNYEIVLNCDFDTMVSVAETINVKG